MSSEGQESSFFLLLSDHLWPFALRTPPVGEAGEDSHSSQDPSGIRHPAAARSPLVGGL